MGRLILTSSLLAVVTSLASADEGDGPRLRMGRVEFGVPFLDSFVTVNGDRATVKVFSRGDITNVHTDDGTQVDVGIRSLFVPRQPMRGPGVAPPGDRKRRGPAAPTTVPDTDPSTVQFGESQPIGIGEVDAPRDVILGDARKSPAAEPIEQTAGTIEPRDTQPANTRDSQAASPLVRAEHANERGSYRTAELLASAALKRNENDHQAHSVRAAALIGQGEKERNIDLIQQGLDDVNRAIQLGQEQGEEVMRDYLVRLIGMNQLAVLDNDRRQAARHAELVDDFATQHVARFPDELKENVYQQQGFARLLLGRRQAASESFRNAAQFRSRP